KTKAQMISLLKGEMKKTPEKPKTPKKSTKKGGRKPKAKSSPKKTVAKKAKERCDAEEDYLVCEDGSICNTATGRCIKDTAANRKKYPESITLQDGRKIIGSKASIEKLRELLGDQVVEEEPTEIVIRKKVRKCDQAEDYVECDEDDVCDADLHECVKDSKEARSGKNYELQVEGRKIIGKK